MRALRGTRVKEWLRDRWLTKAEMALTLEGLKQVSGINKRRGLGLGLHFTEMDD